jgi:hypothetical protein
MTKDVELGEEKTKKNHGVCVGYRPGITWSHLEAPRK